MLEDRLDHAADLYNARLADLIVVTGGRQEGDRFSEANAGFNYLRDRGVPEEALRQEVDGSNSWESLAATARILRGEGITDMVVVSDAYHSLRLEGIASELGFEAYVSPAETGTTDIRAILRETVAVGAGRLLGYRRLMNLDDTVGRVRGGGGDG